MTTKSKPAVPKSSKPFKRSISKLDRMDDIVMSAQKSQLIVVVGAGVSSGLTNGQSPSWPALVKGGFDYGNRKGRITDAHMTTWSNQLASSDIDDLLGAAEFMGRKLGAPTDPVYARWLEEVFGSIHPANPHLVSAFKAIASLQIPICTLNYDHLLEEITGLPALQVSDAPKVISWMRREYKAILHLHGSWDIPASCILGIRDYETTQTNEVRDLFQRNLAAFNHLLFIGCGDTFADPNFSALVSWLRTKLKALTPPHVALTREDDVPKRNADPAWIGFVEPVSFGKAHKDLAEFLTQQFSRVEPPKPKRRNTTAASSTNAILDQYRAFLLRDCGQMTIEGVSADMDTGQRKFDLERLFVPLNVSACPPEYPASDPESEAKLAKWHKENNAEKSFGVILTKHKRVALLALPGGGKTLLLKRIAVAYADPARRSACSDELPELPLLPVLIRCREWREHIRLPIQTLLQKIGDITGQSSLTGLSDALVPLLKKGQVLLLVDGLDEIHNDADRATFVDHLEAFLEQYKLIRLVVTSREAGFGLVAPAISRFCNRWRLAPLSKSAIELLCHHWHRLMTGDAPAAIADGREVAQTLLKNGALRRLAENPLLLTMLLVVKHGAGGLPPDRVSLYGRAVDVLLDTWNIKGHDPLNPKEAVPQLAYVAFQLTCKGKQTATEKELLTLLEEARDKHPSIKRYAKDSSYDFLKRVELRSSLLLEAGHQIEGRRTVPFYQFRHLTFQEYLTAVAVTEGHYGQYRQADTVLTPLENYLLAEEWKEVIPMVAVLARKRAEPLLIELIERGNALRKEMEGDGSEPLFVERDKSLPGPAGRLLQCFVEEAEASPQTISAALRLIAYFGHGCKTADDWEQLCRGPYGEELYSQAWELLVSKQWPNESWLMNTCAAIAEFQRPRNYWGSEKGREQVRSLLQSCQKEDLGRGLLISMGLLWNHTERNEKVIEHIQIDLIEPLLLHKDRDIWPVAAWVWTNTRRRQERPGKVSREILDTFLVHWLEDRNDRAAGINEYAMSWQVGIDRDFWTPTLSMEQRLRARERLFDNSEADELSDRFHKIASFLVAYHAKSVCSDQELVTQLDVVAKIRRLGSGSDRQWDNVRTALGGIPGSKRTRKVKKR